MTRTAAIARYIPFIVFAIACSGCVPSRDVTPVTAVDLVRQIDRAEMRPPASFELSSQERGGVVHPSIVGPAPSRIIWSLPMPQRGVFRAFVSVAPAPDRPSARLRIGVSDHRIYEGLAEVLLPPDGREWIELRADLSAYAGWKWSLFYRPDRTTWRLVLAADVTDGAPARVVWGSPEILTDSESVREYAARRQMSGP